MDEIGSEEASGIEVDQNKFNMFEWNEENIVVNDSFDEGIHIVENEEEE